LEQDSLTLRRVNFRAVEVRAAAALRAGQTQARLTRNLLWLSIHQPENRGRAKTDASLGVDPDEL